MGGGRARRPGPRRVRTAESGLGIGGRRARGRCYYCGARERAEPPRPGAGTRREGPALQARGVLPTALAASSGRHAEPSPGKSGARAAGPGTQAASAWDAGTLGGGGLPSGVRALREHPEGSRGESEIIPGARRRRVAAGAGSRRAPGGARFLSVPLARPRPSGSGMGGGVFRPFLSQKLFLLQPARGQYVGKRGPGIPASGVAWRDRGGVGGP